MKYIAKCKKNGYNTNRYYSTTKKIFILHDCDI